VVIDIHLPSCYGSDHIMKNNISQGISRGYAIIVLASENQNCTFIYMMPMLGNVLCRIRDFFLGLFLSVTDESKL